MCEKQYVLALDFGELPFIGTEPEATVEQLDSNDGKDELEQHVHDQDVEYVLE